MNQPEVKNASQNRLSFPELIKYVQITFLGFSAGIPYFLIFSNLSTWLQQAGLAKTAITFFSWAALGYSFKFLWAPLVDRIPIFGLTKLLGQRRSWMLLSQLTVIGAIVWMAMIDPQLGENQLTSMALAAVTLGFAAATQDISIDAWRIEVSNESQIFMMSSLYTAGYRVGMVTSGAGGLAIAGYFGASMESYNYSAWQISYLVMAVAMMLGVLVTFLITEPEVRKKDQQYSVQDYLGVILIFAVFIFVFIMLYRWLGDMSESMKLALEDWIGHSGTAGVIAGGVRLFSSLSLGVLSGAFVYRSRLTNKQMTYDTYVAPVLNLLHTYKKDAWLLIGIIVLYRVADIVLGTSANLFYQDLGFNLTEIAAASKTFGLIMTVLGGLIGGVIARKYGVIRTMIVGAIASAATNLLFMVMAGLGDNIYYLIFLITADNLAQGFSLVAFVSFLSILVNKEFTATQYAIFSSIMTLFPKILGGYSGGMIDSMGYSTFFLSTAIMGVPAVLLLLVAYKKGKFTGK